MNDRLIRARPDDLARWSKPNAARIYDYLLGGKDNFKVDRDAADSLLGLIPEVAKAAKANRDFLKRVVSYLVGQVGIRQIIDIGTGFPTQNTVHEVAQRIAPETRVVYLDNDPMVVTHGRTLLATNERVAMVEADLRAPGEMITHRDVNRLIDFGSPVAVLMLASLHFVTDAEDPRAIVEWWRNTMWPGSYLAVSHITADAVEPAIAKAAQEVYAEASAPAVPRTLAEVESFFGDFELLPPGVVDINAWPVPVPGHGPEDRVLLYGGVGRKLAGETESAHGGWQGDEEAVSGVPV